MVFLVCGKVPLYASGAQLPTCTGAWGGLIVPHGAIAMLIGVFAIEFD